MSESIATAANTATPAEVRDWARRNGHDVGDRGRISREVTAAFRAATGKDVK